MGESSSGFAAGVLGGVITFILTEILIRTPRERLGVAEALAAELTNVSAYLASFIDSEDREEIPGYFRCSHVVFDAVSARLSMLNYEDIAVVARVYNYLDELNAMPPVWRNRALRARSSGAGNQDREAELRALEEARREFFAMLPKLRNDCSGLAVHLRTKYTLGIGSLVPLRFRRDKKIAS